MNKYGRATVCVALLWASAATAQGTVMNGDSSGTARKPGTQGAVGTAGASAVRGARPPADAPNRAAQSPPEGLRDGHGNRAGTAPASGNSLSH